ncbi:MAG: acyl-CoA thioesterase [Planctomycetaceae bacterium]|nr:MAG: acyl-CoA thioesterase [Planctomycetaceae bacterium]
MNDSFQYNHTVTPDEIDQQDHVHNLRYLRWTLSAAHAHSAAGGWDSQAQLQRGIGWVVRSHDITYRAAALAGDELVVQTWLSEVTPMAIRRRYVIARPADRTVLAKAETRWVLVDLRDRKAIRLDPETLASLQVRESAPPLPWQ